jgi:6-phosphofructokinase 1
MTETAPASADRAAYRVDSIAVLTSGGDSQGMNAAVRAVVRSCIHREVPVYAVREGYRGMVEGGDQIRPLSSEDVGGILRRGGTVIGSARCAEFRTREGRRRAARNLVERGIDALVVIGGDGSLTGANVFREEWPELLDELVASGEIDQALREAHPALRLVGLVGSIDNDMFGTDMTIGADSALHRITEALDAIHSTASSHQRTFVVEVMGRHCGYLALMSALATGANYLLIPEHPPAVEDWEADMCEALKAGKAIGRRQSMVIVAEGAQDRNGKEITADHVKEVLEERLGEDTRVTILGHVQRGGSPSAFDRYMSTQLGHAAVDALLTMGPDDPAQLVGLREHQVRCSPLMDAVEQTHAVAERIAAQDYDEAMRMRGGSFTESFETFRTLMRAYPRDAPDAQQRLRIGVLHAGGPAPGMNTAARVAVRHGIDQGHAMFAVQGGFPGLADGAIREMDWMSVSGWVAQGGAELGTSRTVPSADDVLRIAEQIAAHRLDALLMIGGWAGYEAAYALHVTRDQHPALRIPIVCLPASINNDLPGSELSVGADTALNAIVVDVDKIKQSAVASRRCFVVEVMGNECGYLALLGGLSTGAERVYLPEEGITLDDLREDVGRMADEFRHGKRLGLIIRNEEADSVYTTGFIHALFEKEGGRLFDVRESILGHVQDGGDPSPFDRIQASRLAKRCIDYLIHPPEEEGATSAFVGLQAGHVQFTDLGRFPMLIARDARRPKEQRWLNLRPLARVMARPDVSDLVEQPATAPARREPERSGG